MVFVLPTRHSNYYLYDKDYAPKHAARRSYHRAFNLLWWPLLRDVLHD